MRAPVVAGLDPAIHAFMATSFLAEPNLESRSSGFDALKDNAAKEK
jgi:hypothetical protein